MTITKPDLIVTNSANASAPLMMEDMLSVKELFGIFLRHLKLILLCVILGLVCGFIYIFFAQPRYTATTSILIDPRQQKMLPEMLGNQFSFSDNLVIDSQIEVIRSTKLLEKVALKSGLYDGVENSNKSFLGSIKQTLFGEEGQDQQQDLEISRTKQARLNGFRSGIQVARVQGTYVIKIGYTSMNPDMAARTANLIADVYLEDDLEAQYEASERTNAWLKSRLSVLRSELTAAEGAVETFKEENDLLQSAGQTISEKQLSELNAALAEARMESTRMQARYDRLRKMIDDGDTSPSVTELLDNRIISGLHDKYIDLSRHATEIKRKQGDQHQAYLNLNRQMEDIQRIILKEYERIAESYKTEAEIARSRLDALQSEMQSVAEGSSVARRSEIELRELERRAESTRNLYTKMLDNFNEQTERQSVPIVNARIISYAGIPQRPSWPNEKYILTISLILGLAAGGALAFLREQFNRFIWKAEEIEQVTHRTCLGMLPKIAFDGSKLLKSSPDAQARARKDFNVDGFKEVTQLLNKQTGVVTEIMRNIQLAIQFRKSDSEANRKAKIISFVSASPSEGKSITSCFLASHLAKSGAKVLLIDCDFRRPSLTNWFMAGAPLGFYEVSSQLGSTISHEQLGAEIAKVTHETGEERLHFIPGKGSMTAITNLNLVTSGQMHETLQYLQTQYDAILIDLPPIINIVDARVVASSIDCFVFLAHWGKTDRDVVKKALFRAPEVYNRTVGALLTLVDTEKAGTYGYYNYNYYYQR